MAAVKRTKERSPIDSAALQLRKLAMSAAAGTLLGSEDEIVAKLEVARATLRQAARLLERDGVLRVRRGTRGGYFSARPSSALIESVFCTYLGTLGLDTRHTDTVAKALWVESMREAACAERGKAHALVDELTSMIEGLPADLTIDHVARVERESRSAIFSLIGGHYLALLFNISVAYARQQLGVRMRRCDPASHRKFVRKWKKVKLLELEAIGDGDADLAALAAMRNGRQWEIRMSGLMETANQTRSI
jgi:GntR family transcriptional regulator, transcriptional repressor for pyruvate dehydrogenase complex